MFEDQELLYGNCHFDSIKKAMSNFWTIASDIREELGDKSYYLDEYLSIILDSIGSACTSNAAFSGKKYIQNYNMPDYAISVDRLKQIVNIVGKEKVERLESAIEEAFIISPVSLILVQSIITRLAEGLCLRDPQTSKQIFQLILDLKKNNRE